MSREIKFRVWDKEEKEYYYDAEYTHDFRCSGRGCYAESFGEVLDYPERYAVEQYTGLKDSNGKEIYENDIVVNGTLTGVVKYMTNNFCAWTTKVTTDSVILLTGTWTSIGNIHENPELLEEEK